MDGNTPTKTANSVADWLGYLTRNEVSYLKQLSQDVPVGGTIINIGAGGGTSALAFVEQRPDCYVITVDNSDRWLAHERLMMQEAGIVIGTNFRQVVGDSREIARTWQKLVDPRFHKADLIFVDDGHLKDEITGDVELWIHNVRPGGVMAFHDYGSPFWPDVKSVLDDFMQGFPLLQIVDTTIAYTIRRQ